MAPRGFFLSLCASSLVSDFPDTAPDHLCHFIDADRIDAAAQPLQALPPHQALRRAETGGFPMGTGQVPSKGRRAGSAGKVDGGGGGTEYGHDRQAESGAHVHQAGIVADEKDRAAQQGGDPLEVKVRGGPYPVRMAGGGQKRVGGALLGAAEEEDLRIEQLHQQVGRGGQPGGGPAFQRGRGRRRKADEGLLPGPPGKEPVGKHEILLPEMEAGGDFSGISIPQS